VTALQVRIAVASDPGVALTDVAARVPELPLPLPVPVAVQ
jgi:hypothetical protein